MQRLKMPLNSNVTRCQTMYRVCLVTRMTKSSTLVKLTNEEHIHYGYRYSAGLNINPQEWNDEECCDGGFYVCEFNDFPRWLGLRSGPMKYIYDVEIPEDATVCKFTHKIKCNKLILSNKRLISDLEEWKDVYFQLNAVNVNGYYSIGYISNPSELVQLAAVCLNGYSIQFISDPSEAVQLAF